MIKLITIDLDGTLFDKEKNIDKRNIESIKKARENGVYVVIATGRPYNGVKKTLTKLGMTTNNDYVICYNGAKIINVGTNEVIDLVTVDGTCVQDIYNQSLKYDVNIHAFRDNEELLTPKDNQYTDVETRINEISRTIFDFKNIKTEDKFIKVMLVDDPARLDFIEKDISLEIQEKYSMVRSSHIFLEFINKNVDKGFALIKLAKYLNISMDETMAIGDAGNDKHMIEVAKVGVAMDNAFDYVKEISNYITSSNEDAGVSKAINKFIFNED